MSSRDAMRTAQSLYEKHKITSYPRTPCRYLPKSQQAEVPQVFAALLALDPSLTTVLQEADAQRPSRGWNDAQVNKHSHHAIIPTTVANADLSALSKAERDLYLMIRSRYIAQFYPDYEYEATVIETECCGHLFRTVGRRPAKAGWKSLLGDADEETEGSLKDGDEEQDSGQTLPPVKAGDAVQGSRSKAQQKQTAPPPRFTEPSLLDEMQTLSDFLKTVNDEQIKKVLRRTEGLGTEATRAAIIKRLFEMGYLEKKKRKVYATEKGRRLIARIPKTIADPVTTAKWEMALSAIETGKISLEEFTAYQEGMIRKLVAEAQADAKKGSEKKKKKAFKKFSGGPVAS